MTTHNLFTPLTLGGLQLSHRVVMPPLTRMRADAASNAANAMMAQYYGQRATAGGFIICEASQISPDGKGIPCTPGIHSAEQIAGWKLVSDAIHAKGGIAYLQLWHMGRLSHPSHQPGGALPIAPSAIAAAGEATTADFTKEPFPTPRALETAEISALVDRYAQAARNAKAAGFDGVEIHAANGYLLEQFLQSRTNQRTDIYGGSIENRCRVVLDVVQAISQVWGASRVGIRLSPYGIANDSGEADPMPLYSHLIRQLDAFGLSYLHLIEPRASGAGQREVDHQNVPSAARLFRPMWHGRLIAAGNFRAEGANAMIADGDADAIAFGRLFISNPDLPERLRVGASLTPYNRATFYSRGPEGYLDYATMSAAAAG